MIKRDPTIKKPNIVLPTRINNEHNAVAVADTFCTVIDIIFEEFFLE